ncbi:MAG: FAD-dependent oxidoreductase [Dehalococcoidales bacterium]|nr:FAD-dependent oxidoreductase [Dehalococcoidales bacterium]
MKNLSADAVVIGAGGAGVCAAVTLVEGGARVITFEKSHTAGSSQTSFAGAIFAVESRMQREAGENLTRDEVFRLLMEHTHWRTDARLARAYINKSASTIDWLENHGVKLDGLGRYVKDGYRTMHLSKGIGHGHGGAVIIKYLMDTARQKGAGIYLGTPVTKIIKTGNKVKGVIARDKSKTIFQVEAKAVIIATGGYAYNKEMMKQHGGYDLGRNLVILHKFKHITGDGIQMAWAIGAASDGMGPQLSGKNIPGPGIERGVPWLVKNQLRVLEDQPFLWVNQEGRRFMNEQIVLHHPNTSNAIVRQKGKCAYFIFDGNTKRHIEEEGVDFTPSPMWGDKKIVDLDNQIDQCVAEGNENIFKADSLEELASKMGVNTAEFQKTIKEYNESCNKGYDDLFAKSPQYLQPVKLPAFYAFKVVPIAYGTLGGIKINENTEVLNQKGEVIQGLYAVGNDANGIFGDPPIYNYQSTSGSALAFALNSGRIAGENALKYIGK